MGQGVGVDDLMVVLVQRYVNDDINDCICVFVECMLMMSFLYKILVNGYLKN